MVDATPEYSEMADGFDVVSRAAVDYESTPILPAPQGLEPIYPDDPDCGAYFVRSFLPMKPLVAFPITMTVYRSPTDGSVTIFNSFRVPSQVEDAILALGPVRNVVKLGQFHGQFDPYYIRHSKFNSPKYWAAEGATVSKGLEINTLLTQENIGGVNEEAQLYTMPEMPFIESVVTLPVPNHGRLLVACDSFMNIYSSYGTGLLGRIAMYWMDFLCKKDTPLPGPIWSKLAVKIAGKDACAGWFRHIHSMEWSSVVGGHGPPAVDCDQDKIQEALAIKLASM